MTKNGRGWILSLLALSLLLAASCAKKAEEQVASTSSTTEMMPAPAGVTVTAVDLGKTLGADKRVTDPTREFKPMDMIYATVVTTGAAERAVIKAKWTFEDGQVVDETEQEIVPNGQTATEFHIGSPKGLPAGKYKLDVFLDGQWAKSVEYEVKA